MAAARILLVEDDGPTAEVVSAYLVSHGIDVDPLGGTAETVASWDLGQSCQRQGSVFELANGGVLVTCPDQSLAEAYDAAGATTWSVTATCGGSGGPGGGSQGISRIVPVSL